MLNFQLIQESLAKGAGSTATWSQFCKIFCHWDFAFLPLNQTQFRVNISKCLSLRKRATQIFEALDVRHRGWLEALPDF